MELFSLVDGGRIFLGGGRGAGSGVGEFSTLAQSQPSPHNPDVISGLRGYFFGDP